MNGLFHFLKISRVQEPRSCFRISRCRSASTALESFWLFLSKCEQGRCAASIATPTGWFARYTFFHRDFVEHTPSSICVQFELEPAIRQWRINRRPLYPPRRKLLGNERNNRKIRYHFGNQTDFFAFSQLSTGYSKFCIDPAGVSVKTISSASYAHPVFSLWWT